LDESELIDYVLKMHQSNKTGFDLSPEFIRSCINVTRTNINAMKHYKPNSIDKEILFFKHTISLPEYSPYPERDWIELSDRGIRIIKIPGNHYTMNLEPNVSKIADYLNQRLDNDNKG
jgi:thioesterase domain-containing protein